MFLSFTPYLQGFMMNDVKLQAQAVPTHVRLPLDSRSCFSLLGDADPVRIDPCWMFEDVTLPNRFLWSIEKTLEHWKAVHLVSTSRQLTMVGNGWHVMLKFAELSQEASYIAWEPTTGFAFGLVVAVFPAFCRAFFHVGQFWQIILLTSGIDKTGSTAQMSWVDFSEKCRVQLSEVEAAQGFQGTDAHACVFVCVCACDLCRLEEGMTSTEMVASIKSTGCCSSSHRRISQSLCLWRAARGGGEPVKLHPQCVTCQNPGIDEWDRISNYAHGLSWAADVEYLQFQTNLIIFNV